MSCIMSSDHIFIVPSKAELNTEFELKGFRRSLVTGRQCPRNVSIKPPAIDHTFISVSMLPVSSNFEVVE